MKLNLKNNQRLDDLQFHGLKLLQDTTLYSFTSDAVVLANFLRIKKNEMAVEIGAGNGVISILATHKTNVKKIVAFELQEKLCKLAQENLKLNNIENVQIINDKVQNFSKYLSKGSVDVVFSNPPYKKDGSAILNENESKTIARHEKYLPLKDLCRCASEMLKFGGRAFFVYDADRSCEMIYELKHCGLEPKKMFFTENGKGKVVLFVVEAVKGGKPSVKVFPNLVTNDKEGDYIEAIKNMSLNQ